METKMASNAVRKCTRKPQGLVYRDARRANVVGGDPNTLSFILRLRTKCTNRPDYKSVLPVCRNTVLGAIPPRILPLRVGSSLKAGFIGHAFDIEDAGL